MLKSKTVNDKPAEEDGYRLLITREWPAGKGANFADGFNPRLAPSQELHEKLMQKQMGFERFEQEYLLELEGQKERLASLKKQAEKFDITLVSYADFENKSLGAIAVRKCSALTE